MVLAVSGGVVAAVLRDRDAARDARLRRRQRLIAQLEQTQASYVQLKAARRLLRTLGFDAPTDRKLTPQQVMGFQTQIALLNEAQLTFEGDTHRIPFQRPDLGPISEELLRQLAGI